MMVMMMNYAVIRAYLSLGKVQSDSDLISTQSGQVVVSDEVVLQLPYLLSRERRSLLALFGRRLRFTAARRRYDDILLSSLLLFLEHFARRRRRRYVRIAFTPYLLCYFSRPTTGQSSLAKAASDM